MNSRGRGKKRNLIEQWAEKQYQEECLRLYCEKHNLKLPKKSRTTDKLKKGR